MKKLLHILARLEIELSHLEPLFIALTEEARRLNRKGTKNERQLALF